ncbi:MAG: hypothetical protein IH991_02245, partial [Planctomycetes bacterium]|nr:hypothetical protein [Planctomycetota bacterium]
GGAIEIPVEVDYSLLFSGSDQDAWEQEYLANVRQEVLSQTRVTRTRPLDGAGLIEGEPSELSDPFFYRDDPDWLGLWNNHELVADEQAERYANE